MNRSKTYWSSEYIEHSFCSFQILNVHGNAHRDDKLLEDEINDIRFPKQYNS